MKGLVLTVAVIGILALVVTTKRGSTSSPPSAAPTAIGDQIRFRDQAGLDVRVRAQIDAMKLLAAMGSNAVQALPPVLEANEKLRHDQEALAARCQLAGGDPLPPPANWDEFLSLDATWRLAPP